MYIGEDEFRVLAQLSGKELRKTRYSVPPFGIGLFEGNVHALILAEAEFDSAAHAASLVLPAFLVHEVTMKGSRAAGLSWLRAPTSRVGSRKDEIRLGSW